MNCVVRPMEVEDVAQVVEIDQESFSEMWPPVAYKRELLHNRLARYLVVEESRNHPERSEPDPAPSATPRAGKLGQLFSGVRRLLTAEPSPAPAAPPQQWVVGIAGLWFMVDEAHLTTIAVRGACRRQGIGELLLVSAIELAAQHSARFVTLEVRASNITAQTLYRKYGFAQEGIRVGYYSDNREDALIMTTDRITLASYQSQFQRLKQAHAQRWGYQIRL